MYLPTADVDRTTLRQGDVLTGVPIFGALNPDAVLKTAGADGRVQFWGFNKDLEYADVAVLSHCCEIDRANGVKLTSIVLGPIRDINSATSAEKRQELIATNDIRDAGGASYLKYFYLSPNDAMKFRDGGVVDFSKSFSVRKNAYETLLRAKVAQLHDVGRESFARKLALYFYRTAPAAVLG